MKNSNKVNVVFDKSDRQIIQQNCDLAEALGALLGEFCEIVVHSLENCQIVKIVNGNITKRAVGSPMVSEDYNAWRKYMENPDCKYSVYFFNPTILKKFRSLTFNIFNNEKLIGFLCLNLDTSIALSSLAKLLTQPVGNDKSRRHIVFEELINEEEDIESMIGKTIKKIKEDVSIPVSKKVYITVQQLNNRGFFAIKKGVSQLCEALGVSEQTIYKHLRNLTQKEERSSYNLRQGE